MRKFSVAQKPRKTGKRGPYKTRPKTGTLGDVEDPDKLGTGGIRLRQHRLARGWTVEMLSIEADLSPGTISGIERGELGWSKDSLAKLAKALKTTIGALFDRDPRRGREGEFYVLYERLDAGKRQRVRDFTKGIAEE